MGELSRCCYVLVDTLVADVVAGGRSQGAEINADHPEGVNALMYGAAGAHLGVVQVRQDFLRVTVVIHGGFHL